MIYQCNYIYIHQYFSCYNYLFTSKDMHTYHIYWKEKPIFKNLEEEEFQNIWNKIMYSYNEELNFVRLKSIENLEESSY